MSSPLVAPPRQSSVSGRRPRRRSMAVQPATRGTLTTPRAVPRAGQGPRWRRGSCRRRMAQMAAGRCGSRLRPAVWLASNQPVRACPPARSVAKGGVVWRLTASSRGPCATAQPFWMPAREWTWARPIARRRCPAPFNRRCSATPSRCGSGIAPPPWPVSRSTPSVRKRSTKLCVCLKAWATGSKSCASRRA